jgi:hypothetical protein
MSMYDELYLEVELPDREIPAGTCFQTRSFPAQFLDRYRITAAGRLVNANGRDLEVEGYVTFRPGYDAPAEILDFEYRARFVDGQLQNIVRVGNEPDTRIYGLASINWFDPPPAHFALGENLDETPLSLQTNRQS